MTESRSGGGGSRERRKFNLDDDDTLREVGEDQEIELDEEELDPADRRRDPLRQPH
jgi:hypothetical protein